jgi:hypothetical protein
MCLISLYRCVCKLAFLTEGHAGYRQNYIDPLLGPCSVRICIQRGCAGAERIRRAVRTSPHQYKLTYSGIDVVRNKIKMFAQKKVTLPAGRHKIVILDEADSYV